MDYDNPTPAGVIRETWRWWPAALTVGVALIALFTCLSLFAWHVGGVFQQKTIQRNYSNTVGSQGYQQNLLSEMQQNLGSITGPGGLAETRASLPAASPEQDTVSERLGPVRLGLSLSRRGLRQSQASSSAVTSTSASRAGPAGSGGGGVAERRDPADVIDRECGKVRVLSRQCPTCIFWPGNRAHLAPGRFEAVVRGNVNAGALLTCHSTLPYGDHPGFGPAVCAGFWARHGLRTAAGRIAKHLIGIVRVALPGNPEAAAAAGPEAGK